MVVFTTTFIFEVAHLLDGSSLFLIQFQATRLSCMQALSREVSILCPLSVLALT